MIILLIINMVIFVCNIRSVFLGLSALPKAYITYPETDKKHHFAVFIPARNEEMYIGRLLESLAAVDYPEHLKDVYVIVNNCTDRTEKIAREHGAAIIACTSDVKDKAGALRTGFKSLAGHSEIDAFVVFDADTVADHAFLQELNKAFAQGHRIVQSKRRGLGTSQSWVAQSYEIYYAMQNAFFNHPRALRNLSASINGSGWAVSKDVVERYGFNTCTITEDMEYTLQNALNGEVIAYCEKALNYDDFVRDIRRSMKQRLRWSMGNTQCLRCYSGKLLSKARACFRTARRKAWICLDMLTTNLIPVFVGLGILSMVISIAGAGCSAIVGTIAGREVGMALTTPVFAWLMTSLSAAVALTKSHIGPTGYIKGVLLFPLFLITWFPSLFTSFFRENVRWSELRNKSTNNT